MYIEISIVNSRCFYIQVDSSFKHLTHGHSYFTLASDKGGGGWGGGCWEPPPPCHF